MSRTAMAGLLALCVVGWTLPTSAQGPVSRLVFVAGPKDHGGGGVHEYARDLQALTACLDRSNVPNLSISVVLGRVPDPTELAGVSLVVLESSGDRYQNEQHVLFPFDGATDHQTYDADTRDRLARLDALARSGMGIAVLHYATYVNNATARRYFNDWVGGYYESGFSRTVVTEWASAPAPGGAAHPILRGVAPWTMRDEFYINLRMPDDARRTPLLVATPTADTRMPPPPAAMVPLAGKPLAPEPATVPPSVVSWVVERAGGGRGFVMSGVHAHQNLAVEAYRRFVLNGLVWAAGRDVPVGGVTCPIVLDLVGS